MLDFFAITHEKPNCRYQSQHAICDAGTPVRHTMATSLRSCSMFHNRSNRAHTNKEDAALIKFDGFDELSKKLDELKESAESIQGTQVPLGELLTPGFLAKHTRFLSEDELFEASGLSVQSTEDFEKIPDEEWDNFIQQNTPFASWSDMLSAAGAEWAQKKLGFDEE